MKKQNNLGVRPRKCGSFIVVWTIFLFMLMCLVGCAKKPDATDVAGNTAHDTITVIGETLPAQCKTSAIKKELETAHSAVDTVISTCNTQKELLAEEKARWKWSFIGLVIIIGAYIAKRILK